MNSKSVPDVENPGLKADRSEQLGDQAEEKAKKATQKKNSKCQRTKTSDNTFLNCYFLSITKCGHSMMHVVHDEHKPFQMDKCSCDTCSTSETVHDFINSYEGIDKFEILPLEDHPDSIVVLVHQGQPTKEGYQIYPIDLNSVVPKKCPKPVHQAIWKVTEEVRRRRGL